MAFVSVKTGKQIKLDKGYLSNPIDYQTFVKQQEEKRRNSASYPAAAKNEAAAPKEKAKRNVSTASMIRAEGTPSARPSTVSLQNQLRQAQADLDTDAIMRIKRQLKEAQPRQGAQTVILQNQLRQAQADLDTDAIMRIKRQLKEERARQGKQTVGDRVSDTLSSISSGSAGGYVNAAGTVEEGVKTPGSTLGPEARQKAVTRLQASLDAGRTTDGKPLSQAQRKSIQESISRLSGGAEPSGFAAKAYKLADTLQGDSARFQQQAKEGLGGAGSLLVDAGVSTGQSLLDNALGAVTGTGLLPFVARSFGGAAQEARQSGADTSQQLAYGAGLAAKEYVSEKLFGLTGPQRLTGGGSLDDAIEKGIRNTTERLAKTPGGQKALGVLMTWLSGGATEGAEEVIGSVLENTLVNPFLRAFDPDGRTARQKFEDGLYDALVGAASGLMGGVTSLGYQVNPQTGARTAQGTAQDGAEARPANGLGPDTSPAQSGAVEAQTGPENIFAQTADAIRKEGDAHVRGTLELMQRSAGLETEAAQQETAPGTETADMSLVERIQKSVPQLQGMEPVANVKGNELPSGGKLIDRLARFTASFGNKVLRPGFGEVFFSRGKLKSSMIGHGMGGAKIETFPAVPAIIQRGQQIDFQPNWKGRNYDTYTFAAPVNYKGSPTYIGVIVAKDKQSSRYYLHEVVDEHGNVIFQNTEAPAAVQDGTSALSGDLDTVPAVGAEQMSPSDGRASQMGAVDTVETSGLEDTSAFNTDSTIPQEAETVNPSGADGLGAADAGSPMSQAFVDPDAPVNDGLGNANKGFDSMSAAERIYGVLPDGEKAVRPDDVPAQTTDQNRVSLLARTIKGAGVIPDSFIPSLEQAILDGGFSYTPITNAETAEKVQKTLEYKGWEQARADFSRDVALGRANEEVTAMGELLANAAANAGDTGAALEIMFELSQSVRNAGRAVQAARILKNQSPAGRLYMMQKSVQSMVDAMNLPEGSVKLDEGLLKAYLEAKDDAVRDKVISDIQQDVAGQLPSSLLDKWTALRYVNMLGNFKTQVRNFFGNTGMQGVRAVKDLTAASLEEVYSKLNPQAERTKSAFVGKELMDAAKADYANVKDVALGEGKYQEGFFNDAFARGVDEKRTIFKNSGTWGTEQGKSEFQRSAPMRLARQATDALWKVPEAYRNVTNWAMTRGDEIFTKHTYARALAGYLKANKVTAEQFSSSEWQAKNAQFVDKARMYAIQEAQEATFRDSNAFSNWVSQIGRGKKTPGPVRVLSEGTAPFRKTPANVLVRGEEYSPLGIANTIYKAIQAKQGNATGADVINSLAKTLTGSALFAAGLGLVKGLIPGVKIRGGDDDDDKQRSFDDLTGHQSYSIELGNGISYTLDWLSPGAMPFFMGVQLGDLMEEEGLELKDIERALTSIAEPMLQMSMLQSVNDTLDSLKFSEDNLGQMAVSMALNYLTQGLSNSLVGQFERTLDPERQTTYIDKENPVPSWLQREVGKFSAKTPWLDYNQIPYINAWGETESNGGVGERIATNFFSPGYMSRVQTGQVERELQRVADTAGTTSVFPSRAKQSFTFSKTDTKGKTVKDANGNPIKITKNLTAEEYQTYAKKRGQTSMEVLQSMLNSPGYQKLSDEKKAEAISDAYSYADAIGKMAVSDYRPGDGTVAAGALKTMLPPAGYILYRLHRDRDGDGKVTNLESTQTLQELPDLSDKQRGEAWESMNPKTNPARNPFTGVLAEEEMSPEESATAWGIYGKSGTKEEPYTKKQKKEDLRDELDLTTQEVNRLWNLMKKAAEKK